MARRARRSAILPVIAAPAIAQQGTVTLPGTAALGEATQGVRFVFGCSGNAPGATGALIAELHVPGHAALRPRFDFDAYEGPDARAGRRTRLGPTREDAAAAQPLAASGWIAGGADDTFAFGLAAAIRGDAAGLRTLAARLAPLLEQGGLVWIKGNTRRNGPPIAAALEADATAREALRARLAPCLAAARR